ncbi:MAG: L,D-transpeptidase family protein [Cucumibacter sp.]
MAGALLGGDGATFAQTDEELAHANTLTAKAEIDTFEPILSYDTAYNLQLAIARYEQIVAQGGWIEVPRGIGGLYLDKRDRDVRPLRQFLIQTGDLPADADDNDRRFDEQLDLAVRRFQARHGLTVHGGIDEPTFLAMSVPASVRLDQLRINLQRVQSLAPSISERYVVVNIPAAQIESVQAGTVVGRHTAVVGRIDRQTPILESKIQEINFNPYWTVPKSIIQRDLIRYMNEDPEYLTKYNIRIFDGSGNELSPTQIDWNTDEAVNYMFRQDPGAENSLGHVRINFFNPYDVYLHDTPLKSLFSEISRFNSSGCVRVEGVDDLVRWLLTGNEGWTDEAIQAVFQSGERMDVRLNEPVTILTTYITAWANRGGFVSFRDDIYDFDKTGRLALAE